MEKVNIINDLSDKRYSFIKMREDSYNEVDNSYTYNPHEIDMLGDEIMNRLLEWKDDLTFEFIFEHLTKLGQAPNLLYDDDGRFAITGDGFQNVVSGDEADDMEFQFWVEKKHWKKTIREALDHYLLYEED